MDDYEGTLHRAYGCLPNMSFLLDRSGRVVYKANWTDPRTIELACEQVLFELDGRAQRHRLTPYTVEWAPQRRSERAPFMDGLLANGPTAVREFMDAIEAVHGRAALREMAKWARERGLSGIAEDL